MTPADAAGPAAPGCPGEVVVRRARTSDVPAVRALVDHYAPSRRLLGKATVTLYEDLQEFRVAVVRDPDGTERLAGCGALHVLWADLAEVRTLAVDPALAGRGIGHRLLDALLDEARALGVARVFCLTFETGFFARHGFRAVTEVPVDRQVVEELLQSPDEGVAEFLDLARVRPNTLGNTRMLRDLDLADERALVAGRGQAASRTPGSSTGGSASAASQPRHR